MIMDSRFLHELLIHLLTRDSPFGLGRDPGQPFCIVRAMPCRVQHAFCNSRHPPHFSAAVYNLNWFIRAEQEKGRFRAFLVLLLQITLFKAITRVLSAISSAPSSSAASIRPRETQASSNKRTTRLPSARSCGSGPATSSITHRKSCASNTKSTATTGLIRFFKNGSKRK